LSALASVKAVMTSSRAASAMRAGPGRAGQIERDRTGFQARDVNRLLGDVDGVIAELLEVQRHAEDAAELA